MRHSLLHVKVSIMQKSYKKQLTIKLLWGFPLLFYAIDANAWGLYTHLLSQLMCAHLASCAGTK